MPEYRLRHCILCSDTCGTAFQCNLCRRAVFLWLNRIQNRIDGFKRQGVFIHQETDVVRMAVVGGGNIEEQVISPGALAEKWHDADVDRLEHLADIEIASECGVHVHGNEFDRKISGTFSHAVQEASTKTVRSAGSRKTSMLLGMRAGSYCGSDSRSRLMVLSYSLRAGNSAAGYPDAADRRCLQGTSHTVPDR